MHVFLDLDGVNITQYTLIFWTGISQKCLINIQNHFNRKHVVDDMLLETSNRDSASRSHGNLSNYSKMCSFEV